MEKLKVIIADDNAGCCMLLNAIMLNYCNDIIVARNGIEAVTAWHNHPDTDLVFMDLRMPEMDGFEAIMEIRKFNKKVAIIAITAEVNIGGDENIINPGWTHYIIKPYKRIDLISLVQKCFE